MIGGSMAERISTEKLEREEGWLYYLGADGYTYRKNKESEKIEKVGTERISREDGYLYYIDRYGYVARVKMRKNSAEEQNQTNVDEQKQTKDETNRTSWPLGFCVGLILGLPIALAIFGGVNIFYAVFSIIIYGLWAYKYPKIKGSAMLFADGYLVITFGLIIPLIIKFVIGSKNSWLGKIIWKRL